MKHEIKLQVNRYVTFEVDTDDAYNAIRIAFDQLWDGVTPDDEDLPDAEVQRVTVGDREIELTSRIDFQAPRGADGFYPHKITARENGRVLAEGYTLREVVDAAVSSRPRCGAQINATQYDGAGIAYTCERPVEHGGNHDVRGGAQ